MRRWAVVLCGLVLAIGAGWYGLRWEFYEAGQRSGPVTVVIKRGQGQLAIASDLAQAELILSVQRFVFEARLFGDKRPWRAGEYLFDAALSAADILRQMQDGRTVIRHLTIPEGLTVAQTFALISAAPALDGPLPDPPAEGSLLPETYNYSYGDARADLIHRMQKAMNAALEEAWTNRAPNLPLSSAHELLVLASIVEKETAIEAERPRVAAVYLNRLRQGMRLQADPTVAYGVTGDGTMLGRALTKADLQHPTPYNTYTQTGLPPGPIDDPGKASLMATASPAETDELYFVANGQGGHVFARTLAEHNKNVDAWRQIQKDRQ
jgi:UPF0755 protein